MSQSRDSMVAGMLYATTAYLVWGVVPIYWKQVAWVPALEMLAPRIVGTALLMLVLLVALRRTAELRGFDTASLLRGLGTAGLLSLNWGTFIYAVQTDRVLATSLGYYINPLVSVILGLLVLRERLNLAQSIAVAVAGLGVAYLTYALGSLPWIAVVLALSFGLYGLAHKLWPSPPMAGLAIEMLLMTPIALLGWLWLASRGDAELASASGGWLLVVSLSAAITAVPLLAFHAATRRLPLVSVGMFQYIAPTLSLMLAVVLYDEPFTLPHAICFGCVWLGLALFTVDALARARRSSSGGLT